MHLVKDGAGTPISGVEELREYFARSGKDASAWRVGTEHEMCGVYRSTGMAPPYEGDAGIAAVLNALQKVGWEPVVERGNTIALLRGDTQVTIEPGGQLEHAARPVHHASELESDIKTYVSQVCAPSKDFDIAWLAVGFRPFGSREDISWMPKERYDHMREFLPPRGRLAEDMMKRTATVQVNLDYADAQDAGEKLRTAMSVTSILTALYANSPIVDDADSGFQSYRAEVWRFTDPDRCGLLPFVFEDGDVFSAYVEWALDVPMFFIHRGGYRNVGAMPFRTFLESGWEGERATIEDWELHLSTLFPEARMKKFIEVRGCDASTIPMMLALGPLTKGLLYSSDARREATALTAGMSFADRVELQARVARSGLAAEVPGLEHDGKAVRVGSLARELCAIVRAGLTEVGSDEGRFLDPVDEIAASGRCRADYVRDLWNQGQDRGALIEAMSYPELSSCED